MRITKRRFELFSLYDGTGVARHLEKMAAQGWMLQRIGRTFWQYEQIEPKKLHFSATFLEKASSFDPECSEERDTFHAFCERTGWTFVAGWERMQIFCNEQSDPVPLDTDPETQLRVIHRAMRTTNITLIVLGLISLFFAYGFVGSLIISPIHCLANALGAFSGFCFLLLLILCAAELISYFHWRRKAKQAAQRGDFLPTRGVHRLSAFCMILLIPALLFYLASARTAFQGTFNIAYFLILLLSVNLGELVKRQMKKRGATPRGNRSATAFTAGITAAVLVMIAVPFFISFARDDPDPSIVLLNDPPVNLAELMDDQNAVVTRSINYNHSALFTEYSMTLRSPAEADYLFQLEFTVTRTNIPFLDNWCKEQLLNKYAPWKMKDLQGEFRKIDAAPWGALEAWEFHDQTGTAHNRYLLCYENHTVEFLPDWSLNEKQMAAVGTMLQQA